MSASERGKAVLLVGHGAVARDCPRELVTRLKALEAQRRGRGGPTTEEEVELETRIRRWPRTPTNDPYRKGLEALAERLREHLGNTVLAVAYNEFCAPSIAEAVEALVAGGAADITVVTTMMTSGGAHSEIDIPEALAELRQRFPRIVLRYAWPVAPDLVAEMLARQVDMAVGDGGGKL